MKQQSILSRIMRVTPATILYTSSIIITSALVVSNLVNNYSKGQIVSQAIRQVQTLAPKDLMFATATAHQCAGDTCDFVTEPLASYLLIIVRMKLPNVRVTCVKDKKLSDSMYPTEQESVLYVQFKPTRTSPQT
jgi:hypothetical protein